MSDTVQEIKERLTIQDIVTPYVKLSKAGKSLVGLCPFHKEKTPSFHVSLERGTWHCFGCGLGGDGFSFIEKIEGVDFKGALTLLAEKAGVTVTYSSSARERSSRAERLREIMNRAGEWYAGNLPGSPVASYANGRGITEKTITEWRLGYAPPAWRALLEKLTAEGFTIPELLAAGLIKEADGKPGTYYDRFRNRLMFPIRDVAGRTVAFTGRVVPSVASAKEGAVEMAKYLNSPETELYHKSDILFGMDRAKEAIRARGFSMLVEGQMDALLAHQAGFENAVALSGTALSEKHLTLMKRASDNLMLVLDADAAGLAATARAAELSLRQGLKVKAVRLPEGKDPADLLQSDRAEFASRVAAAQPVIDFFLAILAERERDQHRLVSAAERVVLPLITAMRSPMEREHFTQVTARVLGLSPETIRESLALQKNTESRSGEDTGTIPSAAAGARVSAAPRAERAALLSALGHLYPDTALAKRVESEYRRITGAQPLSPDTLAESTFFQAERLFGEHPSEDAADDLLRAFEETIIREAYQEAVVQLRRAELSGDANAVKDAQAACTRLSARLAACGR